jgi:hypothetical protein
MKDQRKNKFCYCGQEVSMFSTKYCEEHSIRSMGVRKFLEIRTRKAPPKVEPDKCDSCYKRLAGKIVIYEGGVMHRSCWQLSL